MRKVFVLYKSRTLFCQFIQLLSEIFFFQNEGTGKAACLYEVVVLSKAVLLSCL